jgi:hypothetical protein
MSREVRLLSLVKDSEDYWNDLYKLIYNKLPNHYKEIIDDMKPDEISNEYQDEVKKVFDTMFQFVDEDILNSIENYVNFPKIINQRKELDLIRLNELKQKIAKLLEDPTDSIPIDIKESFNKILENHGKGSNIKYYIYTYIVQEYNSTSIKNKIYLLKREATKPHIEENNEKDFYRLYEYINENDEWFDASDLPN